jgi:hypothetical protein
MFIYSVQLIRTGKGLAGNRPLPTAKNYLTSNGNAKTAGSLKSAILKDEIFFAGYFMREFIGILKG